MSRPEPDPASFFAPGSVPHPPRQPSCWVPTRKVIAGTITAGLVAVVVWIVDMLGLVVPVPVAATLTGLLTMGMAYLIPEPAERSGRHWRG